MCVGGERLKPIAKAGMLQVFNLPLTLLVREVPRFTFEVITSDNTEQLTIESKRTTAEENPQNGQGWTGGFGSHFYYFFFFFNIF